MSEQTKNKENQTEQETDESRRNALKKLGTYAAAAPVMLSLLASKKASALSGAASLPGPP